VFVLTTNEKGAVAEAEITAAAVRLGVPVLKPVAEHGRYDLAFEIAGRIYRVQCKWGALSDSGEVIKVNLESFSLTSHGHRRTAYTEDEIDLLATYCDGNDRCYLLSSALVAGRTEIWLRLVPPRNGQRACINLAAEFEFSGAVAQLGERVTGSHEATGSSPVSSIPPPTPIQIGSNLFRNHFGYYLERAAAGDEIRISRHGRPYARLVPAHATLPEVA
jgi:prevent-host-death family protein